MNRYFSAGTLLAIVEIVGCAHASDPEKVATTCTPDVRDASPAHGSTLREEARLTLKKWGFAYCIAKHLPAVQKEAQRAEGAYFQLGSHTEQRVYDSVGHFFDEQFQRDTQVSSIDNQPIVIARCLDIYESDAYGILINAQDKYIRN